MLLAASNIGIKQDIDDEVSKAWVSKLEQVYQKAELTMGNRTDFEQIRNIYLNKNKQIKEKKLKSVLLWGGGIALWFILLGLLWNPAATIVIVVVLIILAIVGIVLFKKR